MNLNSPPVVVSATRLNILIVDDRPENLLTLESILECEERKIFKASSGNDALRLAIRQEFAMILMDIQMPDMDGMEVANLLRSNSKTKNIPIIFVSAVSRNDKPDLSSFEPGTVDCLFKPLDLEETKDKVAFFEKLYRAELNSRNADKALEKALKELDQFVYIVSHDLKAPLRAIENLSNWIVDDLGNAVDPNVGENLGLLKSRVDRMSSLLEGILEFSRCGRIAENEEPIELNQLVHAVFEAMAPPAGCSLVATGLPLIYGGQTRLYKIFAQLIKNSIVHHHDISTCEIKVTAEKNETGFIFRVSDNGPGIKPQYTEKIFELFSTLKSKDEQETSGVGLAIVKRMLEDVGQKIWPELNDHGVTFAFTWNC